MAASPGNTVVLGKVADDPEICILLDPFFHHREHACGDPVQNHAADPRVFFFIIRKAPEQGNHGAAHSFCIEDQNDRCAGLLCQVIRGSFHSGGPGAVKIAHDAFNDGYIGPVFDCRAGQGRRRGICGVFRVCGGEKGVQVP